MSSGSQPGRHSDAIAMSHAEAKHGVARTRSRGVWRGSGLHAYLGGRKHLAGSALAVLGAGLVVIDPVGPQGILLVLAFYLAGAIAAPGGRSVSRYGFEPKRVQQALSNEIAAVSGRVDPEIMTRVLRIELAIRTEILPKLDCLPLGSPELYLVERTACDYLPTAVDAYLRLPTGYVSSQPGSHGRTALEVLLEELELLEAEMRSVAETVHRRDMDRLLAHKRFLAERFKREDASA
ncbi:MAG TPA: hypothetical protein VIN39_04795 [Candidatus Dormibacteraeota bacterium]